MSLRVADQQRLRASGNGIRVDSRIFRSLALRLSEMAAREGIAIRPFESEDLPVFERLEAEKRNDVVVQLGDYVDLCASFVKDGGCLRDGRGLAWRMLARLGWRPLSDWMGRIGDDTVVEFYTASHRQIFRNFRFFELCSYTLEELLCREWHELYWRPEEVTREIFFRGSQLLGGEIGETIWLNAGAHLVYELDSDARNLFRGRFELLSPLYENNVLMGVAAVNQGMRVLSSGLSLKEAQECALRGGVSRMDEVLR